MSNSSTSCPRLLYGDQARFFEDETRPHLKHKRKGVVGMASAGENLNASQFYITTAEDMDSLDEKHTVFGQVAEGFDVIDKLNEAFCDDAGRPFQNIRIRHTIVLDDPYEDPPQLDAHIPEQSPEPQFEAGGRLEEDWALDQDKRPEEEIEQEGRRAGVVGGGKGDCEGGETEQGGDQCRWEGGEGQGRLSRRAQGRCGVRGRGDQVQSGCRAGGRGRGRGPRLTSLTLPHLPAEAHNRAVVLEMIGDLPEADAAPPSNMVFVCKLNAVGGAWGQP